MGQKFNHGKSTKKEYYEKWDRYINFLASVGIVVTGYNPDFSFYWKKDEYVDENGVRKYKVSNDYPISVEIVELMMRLSKGDKL